MLLNVSYLLLARHTLFCYLLPLGQLVPMRFQLLQSHSRESYTKKGTYRGHKSDEGKSNTAYYSFVKDEHHKNMHVTTNSIHIHVHVHVYPCTFLLSSSVACNRPRSVYTSISWKEIEARSTNIPCTPCLHVHVIKRGAICHPITMQEKCPYSLVSHLIAG